MLIAVMASPGIAAESITPHTSSDAASVLQRFIVSQGEGSAWPVETI
jgi:hypothetical protein